MPVVPSQATTCIHVLFKKKINFRQNKTKPCITRALLSSQLVRITFDSHKAILRESIDSQIMKNNGKILNQRYISVGDMNMVMGGYFKSVVLFYLIFLYKYTTDMASKRTTVNAYNFN